MLPDYIPTEQGGPKVRYGLFFALKSSRERLAATSSDEPATDTASSGEVGAGALGSDGVHAVDVRINIPAERTSDGQSSGAWLARKLSLRFRLRRLHTTDAVRLLLEDDRIRPTPNVLCNIALRTAYLCFDALPLILQKLSGWMP